MGQSKKKLKAEAFCDAGFYDCFRKVLHERYDFIRGR